MKILYYDCFCGISGDMNLGAMVDLGVDAGDLTRELGKLSLGSEYEISFRRESKNGIGGTKADVRLKEGPHEAHGHRYLKDVAEIIGRSGLNGRVKQSALEMFRRIAQAEAKVHGTTVDEVHFHEVGAVDSIVDIVGAAVCLDFLRPDRILSSPVQVGGGFVRCAHGLIPVPAPATAELLKDAPLKSGLVPFETATPTGAAILAANVSEFTERMDFTPERIGYGLGSRDLDVPNALRVFLGEARDGTREVQSETQYLLETNIDDMSPELFPYVAEKLFAAGALDVYETPIVMKKGRPAVKLSVLTDADREPEAAAVIFRETTTLGLRRIPVGKRMLRREFLTVGTKYGDVAVKRSYYGGEPVKHKAEYEDCRRLAERNKVPISRVYGEVERAMRDETGENPGGQRNDSVK